MLISFFSVYLVFEVFQDAWRSNKENPCILECCPVLSFHGLKLCKFVSRSDLILISFWVLTIFIPSRFAGVYLVLFCSVSDKSGASLFLPCSHRSALLLARLFE